MKLRRLGFIKIIICLVKEHLKSFFDLNKRIDDQRYYINLDDDFKIKIRPKKKSCVGDIDILKEVLIDDCYRVNSLIQPTSIVVDIGGHIGIFSLLAARIACWGHIYTFEPETNNYNLLVENIKINHFSNITPFNKGVIGSNKTRSRLYLSNCNTGAHSIVNIEEKYIEIETISLKRFMDSVYSGIIDVLKIDCEGGEYELLLNLPLSYFERIKKITIEQHITPIIEQKYDPMTIFNLLLSNKYSVEIVSKKKIKKEGVFWIINGKRTDIN
ncbi:MAG: FkbM family methyltransferase [Ignavibacteria bacterium]|nr:FkbM family methyltransferase [Ignavibacteria bacterium]